MRKLLSEIHERSASHDELVKRLFDAIMDGSDKVTFRALAREATIRAGFAGCLARQAAFYLAERPAAPKCPSRKS